MITDVACAQACLDLYNNNSGFADLLYPEATDGVCWGVRRVGNDDMVVFRGSTTPQDWFRDFVIMPHEPAAHPKFGDIDLGFMLGMDTSCARIFQLLRDTARIYCVGHSLGAARATLFVGMLIERGIEPMRIARVVFGEPRSHCGEFRDYIAGISESMSYRNRGVSWHDIVTDGPLEPFIHDVALTDQKVSPAANDPWGLLRYHRMELYLSGPAVQGTG